MASASNSAPVAEPSDSSRGRKLRKLAGFLECCICRNHLSNAHICGQCSQPFCRTCIDTWLANKQSCPHCRQALTEQTVIKDRTLDQLGAVVSEMRDDERQNRCRLHRREQLFFCFRCEQSICDRCSFEEVHLGHKDKVVLLDVAYDHYNKNTSQDLEWIRNRAHKLKKHEVRMQNNNQQLETVFERVNSILRHTSESIARQYELKLHNQKHAREIFRQRSSPIFAILKKSSRLATREKTASALDQLIKFKKEVKLLRSEASPIDLSNEWMDLSFKNNVLPNPIQLTFRVDMRNCEATVTRSENGFVWKLNLFRLKSCIEWYLRLNQGTPGPYWVALRGCPAKLYDFGLNVDVKLNSEDFRTGYAYEYNSYEKSLETVITVFQARSYAEERQQDYIKQLEMKIAGYEKTLADIREKTGPLQSDQQNDSNTESLQADESDTDDSSS